MKLAQDTARYTSQVRCFLLLDFSIIWSRVIVVLTWLTSRHKLLWWAADRPLILVARYRYSPTSNTQARELEHVSRRFSWYNDVFTAKFWSLPEPAPYLNFVFGDSLRRTFQRESTPLTSALAPKLHLWWGPTISSPTYPSAHAASFLNGKPFVNETDWYFGLHATDLVVLVINIETDSNAVVHLPNLANITCRGM